MDSKLRKAAILASAGAILLVSLLVVYVNSKSGNNRSPLKENNTVSQTKAPDDGETAGNSEAGVGQIGNNLSAFLNDNTFFDPEVNPILEAAKDAESRLSLVVT